MIRLEQTWEVPNSTGNMDSRKGWRSLCALLQSGPWLDLARLLQMIEREFDTLRQKNQWMQRSLYREDRTRILNLARLRLALIQVMAESDPLWSKNTDPRVLVRNNAVQTNAALASLSLRQEDDEWLELKVSELEQMRNLIREVAKKSVQDRSRNIICTARMERSFPPRGINQAPADAHRYTEYYEDRDVSPEVLNSKVKGASGRPARVAVMKLTPLEFAEYEESRR